MRLASGATADRRTLHGVGTSMMISGSCIPVLTGCRGWVAGERFVLSDGATTVIGRSRDCPISLRRITGYLERTPAERDGDHDFNTVSRRHLEIALDKGLATIRDLSTNGVYCNDILITEARQFDLHQGPVQIRLGTRETFRLELEPVSGDGDRLTSIPPHPYT